MKSRILLSLQTIVITFYFIGCGATITPTSDRYKRTAEESAGESTEKETKELKETKTTKETAEEKLPEKKAEKPPKYPELREDFDITPYKTKIEIENTAGKEEKKTNDVWVEYEKSNLKTDNQTVTSKVLPGFRVQVSSTDNLDEANTLKSEVYFKIKQPVYVIYDSPFYKVRAGDFLDITRAKDLNFKLNQLGYKDTRVVPDSVNIVK